MTEHTLSEAEYDAITDAAAHWCMRLHAVDCTDAERLAFKQWHDADPLHAFEYQAMLEIWAVADHLPRVEAPPSPTPVSRPRSSWSRWAVAAAVLVLGMPLAAYTGWSLGWVANSYERFEADTSVRHITLSDGSQIELNLGSELVFANYKHERRVTLKKGEAFFDVSHDTRHPFVVRAGQGQVRVTGTRFNVWLYQDQVRVTLVEGSVWVTSHQALAGTGSQLSPGMQASYKAGDYQPQVRDVEDNDSSLAWRNGKLVLDNLALSDALPLINRYLERPVMLADNSTGALRIGGIYNLNEVKNLVPSLPKVLPVYLTQNKDGNPVLNSIGQRPSN
ncbi:FecR family protein [Pseudomonas fluorescens]|uniref:FecR family protein n=1 Tax=Pseudomonas fluorescens TaxID=294 RepID=A0A944DHN8_PSEFL|nr:FecR family protein [Pseudomonas fluorescens]MBT2298621.1 FecR family protein [Pseudomonas fluorescens]MBT2310146.1 FecR family protein [Pseudomonas fluorescens]MBT2311170.1 FecR family protein [Pseudomonas fluorescens]MBT2319895.1 FecR family protein [Pseudomonas fluorescens]MBT2329077.1 FecR family protein [Pseudomonas fluorescens]